MELTAENVENSTIDAIFRRQRAHSLLLRQDSLMTRKKHLSAMLDWILNNREVIKEAIHRDFKKPALEIDTSEIYPVITEIRHCLSNLDDWAKPVKVDAPLTYLGTRSEIRYEAKGACLILSPWNFPFNLCLGPLVSCLAAGNTAILKPSELTPSTSRMIKRMIADLFEDELVSVVEGGAEVSTHLLSLPFDHIFFTGSPAVGKIVMRAAAEHLTSVTLELGGKSPVIIDRTANINDAAKRIAFGKFLNNGQTCIAPDYVMIEEAVKQPFIDELKKQVLRLFGDGNTINELSPSYARIVNTRNFQRLSGLLQDAVERGAAIELSGPINSESRFFHPTLLTGVSPDSRIMEEEIFGPVLPIITFQSPGEVIHRVNHLPKPLALYIFSKRRRFRETVVRETSAGGVCINDCIVQFTHPGLPFGGVNNSGIGKSHGRYGFIAFSNEKPVLRQKSGYSPAYMLHPPYTTGMKKIVDTLLRWF